MGKTHYKFFLIIFNLNFGNLGNLGFFPVNMLSVNATNNTVINIPNITAPKIIPKVNRIGKNNAKAILNLKGIIGLPRIFNLLVFTKMNNPISKNAYAVNFCHMGIVAINASNMINRDYGSIYKHL